MAARKKVETETVDTPIPTADALVKRIKAGLAADGRKFREEHPELVARLAEMLNGVKRGSRLYVENRQHDLDIDEVTWCLDGLGYMVKPAHPMMVSRTGSFWIMWLPDDKVDPYIE